MKLEHFLRQARPAEDIEDRRGRPPPTQQEIDRTLGLGLLMASKYWGRGPNGQLAIDAGYFDIDRLPFAEFLNIHEPKKGKRKSND
jgi:hypothetical protein